jgi:hypothetical protein
MEEWHTIDLLTYFMDSDVSDRWHANHEYEG